MLPDSPEFVPTRDELNRFVAEIGPEIEQLVLARLKSGHHPWAQQLVGTEMVTGAVIEGMSELQQGEEPAAIVAGMFSQGFEMGFRYALWKAKHDS